MNFEQEFHLHFGDKYNFLNLKSVVAKKSEGNVVVTFLYPSEKQELSEEEKKEIILWLKELLSLEKLTLRVKFMRVFVEERLILKAIKEFFEKKYKLVNTYLSNKAFKITISPLDVKVEVELSSRLQAFFKENDVAGELSKYLKSVFLVDFVVMSVENPSLVDEVDIENVEMKATYFVTRRHKVEILKRVAGTEIATKNIPKPQDEQLSSDEDNSLSETQNQKNAEIRIAFPQFVSSVKEPKRDILLAGFIKKIERKEFVMKKGKREGQEKSYFPFVLQDKSGTIDCIYFCPKAYQKNMDSLEESMYVAVHGEAKLNKSGKLQVVVDKIALANIVHEEKAKTKLEYAGPVVKIEKIDALEQDSMFGHKNRYNKKIMGRKIVVFDLETTGLNVESDQITEIGAVKIDNGNIIERFSTFVKPTKRIPYDVTKLTGITNEMVENAPPVEFVIRDFFNFAEGCVLCGHNIINFDLPIIKREAMAIGLSFDNEIIDTYNEARIARLKTTSFKLSTVTKLLGVSLEGAHRAWNDAFATAQVLLKLNLA